MAAVDAPLTLSASERVSGRPRPRPALGRAARAAIALGIITLSFGVLIPRISGASWSPVWSTVSHVPLWALGLLTCLWIGGLMLHTLTLTAALPGLTARQALRMSLTGSAVANLLPVGGAAGVALNHRMARRWGHSSSDFAVYTVLTNLWDVGIKLALAAMAVPLLAAHGGVLGALAAPALGGALLAGAAVAIVIALGVSDHATRRAARWTEAAVGRTLRRVRRGPSGAISAALLRVRIACVTVAGRRWPRLTAGMVAYTVALAVLFAACAWAVGLALPWAALAGAFVADRVLTLANLTPGGAGVVEAGMVTVLVALGAAAVPAVAAVVLYRFFTYGLEIPTGAVLLLWWLRAEHHHRGQAVA